MDWIGEVNWLKRIGMNNDNWMQAANKQERLALEQSTCGDRLA